MTRVALALAAFTLAGCYSSVGGPASAATTRTDELWYVKERYFLFVRVAADVYYCQPAQSPHPKVCTKAVLHDD